MSNQDDETPFIPPQTPQPFVSDGLTRHQIEAEEEQERERQGNAQPPAPPELPPPRPPIQIKPLLPDAPPVPIAPAQVPLQPVKPIEPGPDKDAPPKPFDQYDPTTKSADLPKSPMPFDPFDRSTWPRTDKAAAQDRTNKSLFGMIGNFVSRLFRVEKMLEVVIKQMRNVWPPRITQGGDDATTGGLFFVYITKDGGAQGDSTTAATWTYTVTDLAGTALGTGLSPAQARAIGVTQFASPGSLGIGGMIGTSFALAIALGEYHGANSADCTP